MNEDTGESAGSEGTERAPDVQAELIATAREQATEWARAHGVELESVTARPEPEGVEGYYVAFTFRGPSGTFTLCLSYLDMTNAHHIRDKLSAFVPML